jgi:hypothetical protein
MQSTEKPDTLWIGGALDNDDACEIYLDEIGYGYGSEETDDR